MDGQSRGRRVGLDESRIVETEELRRGADWDFLKRDQAADAECLTVLRLGAA